MFVGPVFTRELAITPRRPRHYFYRSVYVGVLMVVICTAWLVVTGSQVIRNVGDMARFGALLFWLMAPLQLALIVFLSAVHAASAVAQEKDRMTLILLLMTRLNNNELVLGKLLASLLNVFVMLLAALPVFAVIVLFGGASIGQVVEAFAVTLLAAIVAGSLGSTLALWREKTFQTLAMTLLCIVFWLAGCEAIALLGSETWADRLSPLRAVLAAARPSLPYSSMADALTSVPAMFVIVATTMTVLLNLVAIWKVRIWNPSREVRPLQRAIEQESIWGTEHDIAHAKASQVGDAATQSREDAVASAAQRLAEDARAEHVDARISSYSGKVRPVWDNPVLWRETMTWAYGRKVMLIKLAYLLLFVMTGGVLYWLISTGQALSRGDVPEGEIPVAAVPLGVFVVVSLVIVNALAVTSITNERDGRALDLLLVTDLSPKEFIFGKLGGVLWVTKEMVLGPMLLCGYLWLEGGMAGGNLIMLVGGLVVMNVFVAMLGIHCGMHYASSRSSIMVSLGTVFFLFLGVATCILMMVAFKGSFTTQVAPFFAFIIGGSVGLFVSLGIRNPSSAILTASIVLPLATFYTITSFLLNHGEYAFVVSATAYGFATAAMMVPAVSEFDIAMGRTKTAEDE